MPSQRKYTIRIPNNQAWKRLQADNLEGYEVEARVKFNDLAPDLPNDPNIRSNEILDKQLTNPEGTPATVKKTAKQEIGSKGFFGYKNKGITMIAKSIEKYNETTYGVHMPEGYGIADGIKTYSIITDVVQEEQRLIDEWVKLHIIVGDFNDDQLLEIAIGLNKGMEVEQFSIFNQQNKFQCIKDVLIGHPAEHWIRYSETDGNKRDDALDNFSDIKHVVSLLTLFNQKKETTKFTEPIGAYVTTSTNVNKFATDETIGETYASLVPQMLEMEEHIRVEGGKKWSEFVKNTKSTEGFKDNNFATRGTKTFSDNTYELTGLQVGYKRLLVKAVTVPLLGAFRDFVKIIDGKAQWTINMNQFKNIFNKCSDEFMKSIKTHGSGLGWKSAQMGRHEAFYDSVRDKVKIHIKE